jgi:hypothetical protein
MAEHCVLCRSVPVFFAGLNPHGVAGSDRNCGVASGLEPACATCDDEELPVRVGVPDCVGTGSEGDVFDDQAGRVLRSRD